MGANESGFKYVLRMQLDELMSQGMNMEEAVERLLLSVPDIMKGDLRAILEEREAKTDEWAQTIRVQLGAGSTAVEPHHNWYLPPEGGGKRWAQLKERMASSGLASAVDSIDASTNAIVSQLAEPFTDQRRRGLVIGNVQSGKTANYAALCTKALDADYRMILILSGIHNNLRTQTQERINRDLGVLENPREWHQLTTPVHDLTASEIKNAAASVGGLGKNRKMIAVMKKNTTRLDYLLDYLDRVDPKDLESTPILIIDDESDQATPDSSTKPEDDPTAINQKMRQVWSKIKNGTYVGYTATPFANVFMDPDTSAKDGLESLYPRDFLHVMPTPKNYFGAEQLFGMRGGTIDAEDVDGPDVIRQIPSEEIPLLAPRGKDDIESFQPAVTKSLGEAIRWFVVATAIRRMRGQKDKHSSMLVHTTHRVRPHAAMRDAIVEFLTPLKEKAKDGDVSSFREVFTREEDRAAHLYSGDGPAPTWPAVEEEIFNVLRLLEVVVDNGEEAAEDRLVYPEDRAKTVIVIGGGTLSRGLTLEGLFVSYFTRTSNAYDTLLQMGRWFGYRPGYEDLQRIWLADGLELDYQFLALVEADMRADIMRMTSEGRTPGDIGVRIRSHPGRLQITSAGKMKHAEQVQFTFQGYPTQTTVFDFEEPSVQERNLQAAMDLLEEIKDHDASVKDNGARLFTDVSFSQIQKFFEHFSIHTRQRSDHELALKWVSEKLPDVPWRVVLASGTRREDKFEAAGFTVQTVNRAPIKNRDGSTVNLRAVMAGSDKIADLIAAGVATSSDAGTDEDQAALRRRPASEGGAGGQGLLVLYPISRNSTSKSRARVGMKEMLGGIDAGLAEGDNPIIGYAMVLPSDVDGTLKNDGDYISLKIQGPVLEADEDDA